MKDQEDTGYKKNVGVNAECYTRDGDFTEEIGIGPRSRFPRSCGEGNGYANNLTAVDKGGLGDYSGITFKCSNSKKIVEIGKTRKET